MATVLLDPSEDPLAHSPRGPELDQRPPRTAQAIFAAVLVGGLAYAGYSVMGDIGASGTALAAGTLVLLGVALLIALGFEFVNGFHDTANAVATVIYTNSMPANLAVVWAGFFNFLGVMLASGAVAWSIVTLLPVDLILNVGSAAGFAMIFALLLAAVIWNLATWYVGLPNSSSHTLIGAVLGVGVANQLIAAGSMAGTSGVDWSQAMKVLNGLWMAPLIGFFAAFILLWLMKLLLRNPNLFREPEPGVPPPTGIRALLIGTCTAVSFAHGSNDGQKGMGLIMLILIGCAPTAYALNRGMPASETPALIASANAAASVYQRIGAQAQLTPVQARDTLRVALQRRDVTQPVTADALTSLSRDLAARMTQYRALANVPADQTAELRRDMYLLHDTGALLLKRGDAKQAFTEAGVNDLKRFQDQLEKGTRNIPLWVKIAVAIALGLGTMIGWKRIVITVGEKIGKTHLTYGMGASAEIVAAGTILAADHFGLPVSTTHILSSGVAGASVANGAGLQGRTIRNMALAWTLTLPIAMALSGTLYWLFLQIAR